MVERPSFYPEELGEGPEVEPTYEQYKEEYEGLREKYFAPESIPPQDLERFLEAGEVREIHPIEDFIQPVLPHADRVLLGQMSAPEHKDVVLGAELVLPDKKKPLLVVYKPESGVNKGTERDEAVVLPLDSSPHFQKEAAAWIVARELDLGHLTVPVVTRSFSEGPGSVRPYIWGEPLAMLSEQTQDQIYEDRKSMEDIALYDFLLQTMDRRPENLVWSQKGEKGYLKAIDHSLTFFPKHFTERYTKKGPRLIIAYDNRYEPPRLREQPLPSRLKEKVKPFVERQAEISQLLSPLLTEEEINDTFTRAEELLRRGIFL